MAKESHYGMSPLRVVITGPECTGKTTLSERLAGYFDTVCVPEYARGYIENLGRNYTFQDVLHIAEKQMQQIKEEFPGKKVIFYDTWLIISKIWFKIVYHHYPEWIDHELQKNSVDLWLLCSTDIPWIADPVRENGGEMRERLFQMYLDEIEKINGKYVIITGSGDQRFLNALKTLRKHFPEIG